MAEALQQAAAAQDIGEVPVGAVVTLNDEVIGVGHNRTIIDHDPSAHAEVVALRNAAKVLSNHRLNNCRLYVTLEPCVMCAGAILQARIEQVYFATFDARHGAAGSLVDVLNSPLMNHRCEVHSGILKDKSQQLLKDFFASKR
ncbi:MAG: tRNA(adenine34) deaminase [Saprospiraceae bacterium]|jgi:tRNA(adenine34) deaminase